MESNDLRDNLRLLYTTLRGDMNARFSRDLPMTELLFDRWERARHLGFGSNTSVYHESCVYGEVKVGHDTWIGPWTLLDGTGGLTIGDWCSISAGVHIYTHDTVAWALTGGKAAYEHAPVTIGNCCFIGPGAIISKGVTIGDHCAIGAGSFVDASIPSFTLAVGSPCRPVRSIRVQPDHSITLVPPASSWDEASG